MENVIINDLGQRWSELQAAEPGLRIRNAAEKLGVTEVELLQTRVGQGVVRLSDDVRAIMGAIGELGHVMALTRNNDVVHERKGVYLNGSINPGPVGLYVGKDIDLRIFWASWASAFAVEEEGKGGVRRSLQFFAVDGEAVHKIYLTEQSDLAAYEALVARFRVEAPVAVEVKPWPAEPAELPDAQVDAEAFRAEWVALKDTHDFYGMVKKYRLSRTQALRLAPAGGYAVPVKASSLRATLMAVAAAELPIMVFVGNKGMIQIHSGPVKKLADVPGWYNVLDPEFNLHVREAAIASAWVVRKPTTDGMVTALECFDAAGTQIVQLFGARKPGIPELEAWRTVMAEVERTEADV